MPSIVVVGASLGGLDALTQLVASLPGGFSTPIVIAQHRTKASDNLLQRLLGSRTALELVEPADKEPVEAGRIYLAPADYHLIVEPTSFALSTEAPVNYARPSIDVLFESAAASHGRGTLGVLLTGSNQDGAAGCQRIKVCGGRVFVPDPLTAHSRIMPDAAIAAAKIDAVLSMTELCAELVRVCS